MASPGGGPVLYFIPHTHWEGAVFKTRDQYLDMGLPNILRALALLEAHPNFRFTLDQVCYVRPFLERFPEEAARFRQFVREGRLGIVGGTDVMLDVNMPGGESFIRQVLYGKRFFRQKLGVDVTVCWQLDTFGHHAQMPQLLAQAGFRSFWFFRGVPSWETPAEFLWEGIDGTRVPAYWLPHGYALSYGSPATVPEFGRFVDERYHMLDPFSKRDRRVAPGGADVCEPEGHLPVVAAAHNAQPDIAVAVELATPQEYEAAVPIDDTFPVVTGELNPIFQGIYSSRIELKQWTRELESALTTAEKLGVLLGSLGEPVADRDLWGAWEPMLFNQAHDLMSGVMTDHVYEDSVCGYDHSRRLARAEVEDRLGRYCARIGTEGPGIPLVVFNSAGARRTDVAHARVGFGQPGVTGVAVVGPDGKPVPAQILRADRLPDGGMVAAEITFVARDVPALGHSLYRVAPRFDAAPPAGEQQVSGEVVLETDALQVVVDAATGAIDHCVLKATGWDALAAPGNIVVREEDHGDLWEPYQPLDGGSRIAMKDPHPIAPRGKGVYSDEQRAEGAQLVVGPVMLQLTVDHAFGDRGQFRTVVRTYQGVPRVDVHTEILNNDEFVRYRVVFPSSIAEGVATHEIPFGAIERPVGIEFPAQNWMDWSDGEKGLALLNRGLPGNAVIDGALVLSLLRSTQIVAYGFGGGYEPGMTSATGLERGKRLAFDYSLVPHEGDWRQAGVFHHGQALNQPLIARTAAPHTGPLPTRWGWAQVEPRHVVVSALRTAPDGAAVLRLYEASGRATPGVRVRLPEGTTRVERANLLEEATGELPVADGAVTFDLRPFEIATLRVVR
ncbi:MAG TPA: glycoside hydrolase family 38 C-terminal domain-containing protein [Armatimonadota bacterium]|nr:glycoside hydrolase family 38 C-terminal domain-containing protein [Armatimonadota bacterium]